MQSMNFVLRAAAVNPYLKSPSELCCTFDSFFCMMQKIICLPFGGIQQEFFSKSLGAPPLEVHWNQAHTEHVRSPIFIRTFLAVFSPSCCPKAWNTTFVCLRLVFFSLNSINIYIAAEGVGSPSCSGWKLSLDENELQSSLPRHWLVCLYLHYPAIPQLPLLPSW